MNLHYDAVGVLLAANNPALDWSVRHDLLDEALEPQSLWTLPAVLQAQRRQNTDGSWSYHGGSISIRSQEDYAQLATYQHLLVLVSVYRLDRHNPIIKHGAEFLLQRQTRDGDIRGIYGTQYSPNYTADILRLLIEAGYTEDSRVLQGIEWLLSMRQDDGGWAVPLRTKDGTVYARAMKLPKPIEPDRSRRSSYLITGIVLRALAAHRRYRNSSEAVQGAELLASRFFTDDAYIDRKDASYWTKLAFPFRWTDLVSALDSIALVGLRPDEPNVARGLRWLIAHQTASGLWRSGYQKSPDPLNDHWVTFGVARVIKRFFGRAALRLSSRAAALPSTSA